MKAAIQARCNQQAMSRQKSGWSIGAPFTPSEMGACRNMQSALQTALDEHFSTALPQAATAVVDGVQVMGFAEGIADATVGGMLDLVKAWLGDALNAGLLPSKDELLVMVGDAFDKYIAPNPPFSGRPVITKLARMGLLAAVSAAYDAAVKPAGSAPEAA